MISPTAVLFLLSILLQIYPLIAHWNLIKHESLGLEVRFEKALSVTINCIAYTEFENILKIDSSRQVIIDFSG